MIGFVDDVGTVIKVQVRENGAALDISAATIKQILLKPSGAATRTKTASFTTDGVDGYIQYTTVAGDFDTAAEWQVQAVVTLASGTWYTTTGAFRLRDHL